MGHVVLLGDSIFDNASYVPGGPSVIEHLRRILPKGWKATLLATDGAATDGVLGQLMRLPSDATHLIVSAGGNNALDHGSLILNGAARSYSEVMTRLAIIRSEFQRDYRAMLQATLERGLPTFVCTIYDAIPDLEPALESGLSLFNEVILREAFRAGLPLIDLRLICNEASDYSPASRIEPSGPGGGKIARAVIKAIESLTDPHLSRSCIIA
ncbi:SGNH/GDSL hydrolase family protein [Singulisphaera sp. PoT]|uniref:SGNH/GDSL hydrolase family protein n=1 Tax=Singulisphaera sp. PoT TaxID=3411797 RepID=UPI003BF5784D